MRKSKEERQAEAEETEKKKRVKRGQEKRRKKRTKRGQSKRRCEDCVSVEAFEILSQEGDLGICGGLSWGDFLEKPEDLSDCEPVSCAHVRVVPAVTDVLVSPFFGGH